MYFSGTLRALGPLVTTLPGYPPYRRSYTYYDVWGCELQELHAINVHSSYFANLDNGGVSTCTEASLTFFSGILYVVNVVHKRLITVIKWEKLCSLGKI